MGERIVLSPEQLRELLRYDPDTGRLFWLPRPIESFKTKRAAGIFKAKGEGKEAFTCVDQGYKVGSISKVGYKAHRVAWAIHTGKWPESQIDHINGDRSDNRISNLREATNTENQWNISTRTSSRSGLKGVRKSSRGLGWYARICVSGKRINLGYFKTKEAAYDAFCEAANKHHGEFARTS